ncbi:MAG: AMP-binding protein [Rhizobacter sp.]|nr:AMP-binding protein [Rhizobacter sp.]
MNLAQLLVRAARVHPDRPALLLGERLLWRYRELAGRVAALAGHLRALGLAPGERVALLLRNQPAYLEALYAVWWAGLAAVPINARLHPDEVGYIVDNAEASALIADSDLAGAVAPLAARLRATLVPGEATYERAVASTPMVAASRAPTDLAWLFYTSGTTGRPKGVMLSHRNLQAALACYFMDVDAAGARDATVYAAPISHGAGLYNLPFMASAARHVFPESGSFDPAELVSLSRSIGRLCMFAAPTMVRRLVDHVAASGASSDGFKTIVYGGGPMHVEDIRRALATMGQRFVQIYGQGESPMTITALSRAQLADERHPRWLERIASVGVAQTLVEVRVVDGSGADVAVGETGEVVVRGDTVMAGYWNNAEATAQALRDGWLWTGDLGALDREGFLTLKDRSKDLIISGGSNIYPREVEEVLLRHPRVREVSVVGRKDAQWGEAVVAFVACDGDAAVASAELDALCLAHIARFKRPREYRFVAALPKNNYGKVLKTALREQLQREGDER